MKKNIYLMAAASALMLTACTSENDMLQNVTEPQQISQQAVGFDVYTPVATNVTRAGQAGTMTTDRLQRTEAKGGGFGVYAYLTQDEDGTATATTYGGRTTPVAPNFMVNEKILWNATNQGWYYNPLKYWPNETNNDSQGTPAWMQNDHKDGSDAYDNMHLDRLTFFAYAPYVSAGVDEPGITKLTDNAGLLGGTGSTVEASIGYKASLDDPEKAVDLLWGVAPAGGLTYTAVNGTTVKVNEGEPLIDMTKPDVNTTMKFLFQHALARIGINVVAAVDQVGAGGKLDANTRITIDNVTLKGKFGETGVLNLDNDHANVANWKKINDEDITSGTTSLTNDITLTLSADAGTIAPWLRYVGDHTFGSFSAQNEGVTTTKQDLITPRYYPLDQIPAYTPSKQYYTDARATYTVTGSEGYYSKSGENYTKVTSGTITDGGTDPNYYTLTPSVDYPQSGSMPTGKESAKFYTKDASDNYTYTNTGSSISWGSGSKTYYLLTEKAVGMSDYPFVYNNKAVATYTVTGSEGYYTYDSGTKTYTKKTSGTIDAPAIGSTETGLYTIVTTGTANNVACPDAGATYYTKDLSDNYTVEASPTWSGDGSTTYYTVVETAVPSTSIKFAYSGTIYDKERNYFMVVPTNNIKTLNAGLTTKQEEDLRTVRVKIEYYVTTTDSKVEGGRTQTKNVIEKDVLFPSLANGKSYMLNLVLGLTSVKMEAEVDDWKVINVNADLPQNTAE